MDDIFGYVYGTFMVIVGVCLFCFSFAFVDVITTNFEFYALVLPLSFVSMCVVACGILIFGDTKKINNIRKRRR